MPDLSALLSDTATYPPLRLDANENPYGLSPLVQQAIRQALSVSHRYAFNQLPQLRTQIAAHEHVPAEQVLLGAGLSDLLEKLALLLFNQPGTLVQARPTFPLLGQAVESLGSTCRSIDCLPNGSHDLAAMEQAIDDTTRLVYVCTPNNPTGNLTDPAALRRFCERVSRRVPVLIDEAYLDLADNPVSMAGLLAEGHNVIVGRTFSKSRGLAGLRVGYLLAQPAFLARFHRLMPFNGLPLSNLAVQAALASLGDEPFYQTTLRQNALIRRYVLGELHQLGYKTMPPHANFVLFALRQPEALFQAQVQARHIWVKTLTLNGRSWCRLSLGTFAQMQYVCNCLRQLLPA